VELPALKPVLRGREGRVKRGVRDTP